jgi:hypothetical protein
MKRLSLSKETLQILELNQASALEVGKALPPSIHPASCDFTCVDQTCEPPVSQFCSANGCGGGSNGITICVLTCLIC